MKATDRSILIGLVIVGLLAAFWFLLLSPKRDDAAALETQVDDLSAEVAAQEELAAAAEQAEADYGRNYQRLIVLGKAAPADGDTPSLLAQLTDLSERSHTEFASLTTEDVEAAALPAAAQTTTDQNAAEAAAGTEAAPAVPVASAPATEASAATLPLGATVGPAGLGVMPYSLAFSGQFFEIADLLEGIDSNVGVDGTTAKVDGRLVTVNGFTLAPSGTGSDLAVDLSITTYVLPDSQGLTAGATAEAPPATVPAPATSVPTSTPPAP
jgi:Tfp pilus assembly protein PilO